jgi:hypothetical protein
MTVRELESLLSKIGAQKMTVEAVRMYLLGFTKQDREADLGLLGGIHPIPSKLNFKSGGVS